MSNAGTPLNYEYTFVSEVAITVFVKASDPETARELAAQRAGKKLHNMTKRYQRVAYGDLVMHICDDKDPAGYD